MTETRAIRAALQQALDQFGSYARQTLGCGCPEEVFSRLELLDRRATPGGAELAAVLGGRLLVCFFDGGNLAQRAAVGGLATAVGDCLAYRDGQGLHRCRLVVSPPPPDAVRQQLEQLAEAGDDRLHLHCLP